MENIVYEALVLLAITPPTALLIGVIVGGMQTVIDWLDEKEEERRERKEQEKIQKEREKLWDMYLSLEWV